MMDLIRQTTGLNTLDLLLILMLFIGMMIGFVRGVLPQVISVVSIWLGLVASLWLYRPFSNRILQDALNIGRLGGDTLAFLILLLVFFNLIRFFVRRLSTPPEEKKRVRRDPDDPLAAAAKSAAERVAGLFNALGGIAMGFVLTTLWLAILLGVLQFIFQPTDVSFEYTGAARGLVRNLRGSSLLSVFNSVLWGLSQSVDFFIPGNADILRDVIQRFVGTTG